MSYEANERALLAAARALYMRGHVLSLEDSRAIARAAILAYHDALEPTGVGNDERDTRCPTYLDVITESLSGDRFNTQEAAVYIEKALHDAGYKIVRQSCHAARDGDCIWAGCPQMRDGEPRKSGRDCPLEWPSR